MQVASLGSGSKGNATLVRGGDSLLLVDCGFSMAEARLRLACHGVCAENLDGILITHEHGDHIRGVGALARRFNIPVYASAGTLAAVCDGRHGLHGCVTEVLEPGKAVTLADINVMPVAVPHDAREPCQFVFEYQRRRLGVLTDLGSLTVSVKENFDDCDALLLECNYDADLLRDGPYPVSLKRRVGGGLGHLSNDQAARLLAQINSDRLQYLLLCHLSQQNNTPARALAAVHAVLPNGHNRVSVATQDEGFSWLTLQ
ncbi:MAG: MBL fold metallo-hydrolase [Gammaproteobacteria bacterium HGW-Gammaproteobacteria-14]|nr:MAG: MBL fold metallo-hydrolase [Gammaproteobacteria bacterium HGW-Gammaproteobacteria-14]